MEKILVSSISYARLEKEQKKIMGIIPRSFIGD
jgi:hypothetical protein